MPSGMPYTPEAYAWSPVKYVGRSKWVTVGLFIEHVVTADPHEPAVADLLGELEREATRMRQFADLLYDR
jgi:hypothetical protein